MNKTLPNLFIRVTKAILTRWVFCVVGSFLIGFAHIFPEYSQNLMYLTQSWTISAKNKTKNHHHTVSIYQFITLINLNVQNIKDGEENKVLTVQLKIHHCLRVSEWNLKGLLLPVWSRLHFGLFLYPNAKKLQSSCSDSNVPSSADHHHQSHHPAVLRGHKQKKQSALTAKLSLSHLFFFPQEGKDPQSNFKQHSLFLLFQSLCQS